MCGRVGVYCLYHSVCTGITGVCFCLVVCVSVCATVCVVAGLVDSGECGGGGECGGDSSIIIRSESRDSGAAVTPCVAGNGASEFTRTSQLSRPLTVTRRVHPRMAQAASSTGCCQPPSAQSIGGGVLEACRQLCSSVRRAA